MSGPPTIRESAGSSAANSMPCGPIRRLPRSPRPFARTVGFSDATRPSRPKESGPARRPATTKARASAQTAGRRARFGVDAVSQEITPRASPPSLVQAPRASPRNWFSPDFAKAANCPADSFPPSHHRQAERLLRWAAHCALPRKPRHAPAILSAQIAEGRDLATSKSRHSGGRRGAARWRLAPCPAGPRCAPRRSSCPGRRRHVRS